MVALTVSMCVAAAWLVVALVELVRAWDKGHPRLH